jgi:hypothetical protein
MIITATPSAILRNGLVQAISHQAPDDMRHRLCAVAEWAETHAEQLPPWVPFQPAPKPSPLTVLKEEETP